MPPEETENQPAGALNTEHEQAPVQSVPYARFKEVNDALKAERDARRQQDDRLAKLEQAAKDAEEQRLAAQNEYKALYEKAKQELEGLKPYKAQVEEVRAALKATVDAEIASLPEDARELVPLYDDPRQTLEWLTKNKGRLVRPLAPGTDPGQRGDSAPAIKLTTGQQRAARAANMTDEQYIAALIAVQSQSKRE